MHTINITLLVAARDVRPPIGLIRNRQNWKRRRRGLRLGDAGAVDAAAEEAAFRRLEAVLEYLAGVVHRGALRTERWRA